MLERLEATLRARLPEARLQVREVAGLKLALLSEQFPRQPLSRETFQAVWEAPPFWAFAWPAGVWLAETLPAQTLPRPVVDLGCGSGLVSLALARAGHEVIAVDNDPEALLATRTNAQLNGLELQTATELPPRLGTLILADFLYDPTNLQLLPQFQARAERIVLADCRLTRAPADFSGVHWCRSRVVPDLDWNHEFERILVGSWSR